MSADIVLIDSESESDGASQPIRNMYNKRVATQEAVGAPKRLQTRPFGDTSDEQTPQQTSDASDGSSDSDASSSISESEDESDSESAEASDDVSTQKATGTLNGTTRSPSADKQGRREEFSIETQEYMIDDVVELDSEESAGIQEHPNGEEVTSKETNGNKEGDDYTGQGPVPHPLPPHLDEDSSDEELIPHPAQFSAENSSQVDSDSSDSSMDGIEVVSTRRVDGDINRKVVHEARCYLKEEGPVQFVKTYLPKIAKVEDVLRAIEVLGYSIDHSKLVEPSLDTFIEVLRACIQRCLRERIRLTTLSNEDQLLSKLRSANKILIVTGAGISTSLGIPDFRSSKGFYSRLNSLGLSDPQEVFDLSLFRQEPSIFYSIAHMILPPEKDFTPMHAFIRYLDKHDKLLRNYTQNIDNLEANAGINPDKIVQCHGSFANATCMTCKYKVPLSYVREDLVKRTPSFCPRCIKKRAKLERGDEYFEESYGIFKPDITFFGESLPQRFHSMIREDLLNCDLLISVGTSLEVAPVADIVKQLPDNIPQVLINKHPIMHHAFDMSILGPCDDTVSYLCDKLGWELEHKNFKSIVANNRLSLGALNEYEALYSIHAEGEVSS